MKTSFYSISAEAKSQDRIYLNPKTGAIILATPKSSENPPSVATTVVWLHAGTDDRIEPGRITVGTVHPSDWADWVPYNAPFKIEFYPLD